MGILILAAGVGMGAAEVPPGTGSTAEQHPLIRGIQNNRTTLRGIEGMRVGIMGAEGNRTSLRGDV